MPKEQKNLTIYSSSTNAAFEEILRTYSTEGNDIFFPYDRKITEKDPFQPVEMPTRRISNVGAPKIHGAKPQKSAGLTYTMDYDKEV